MVLSGQQIQELQNALISALLNEVPLERMLLVELEKKSSMVANEGNLKDIIFNLIQTANLEGWVEYLICTAYNHNPENPKLQRFIQKISLKKSSDLRIIIEQSLEYEYDNLEELGIGAFGITYRASIKNQQKNVVIKTIKIDQLYQIIKSNNQETEKEFCQEIKSFEQEAEFLSSFKHDHIVRYYQHLTRKLNLVLNNKKDRNLYSVYELELPFLFMEYIEGENLEEYMSKRNFPLEETEALGYIQQIGAAEFCHRLAKHTYRPYRLPSEAEWEYACRAGTTTPFCFGETITTELANYDGNYTYTAGTTAGTKGKFRQETTEVGIFPANAFGLYDMHGNVWEWCQDNYHDSYQGAPTNGKAWLNDNIHQLQVRRGGSWFYYPELCRSAYRNGNIPDLDLNSLGFRVVFASVIAGVS